ncbi:MAG TPA: hypothetical protein DDW89_10800, partial [Gammaproteobacteria bacterium]|nr:hypothetical protein [Gammaproteobacteria bacterium]
MGHKESYVRRWVLAVLLAWAGTGWSAAPAAYDSLKGAQFDQFIMRLQAEPSLLAQDRTLSFRLSTTQWDQMVQALDLDHYTWVYAP